MISDAPSKTYTLVVIAWSTIMVMLMVKLGYSLGNAGLATNSEICYQASKAHQNKASKICLKTVTECKKRTQMQKVSTKIHSVHFLRKSGNSSLLPIVKKLEKTEAEQDHQ